MDQQDRNLPVNQSAAAPTEGSVAYDLSRFDPRRRVREAVSEADEAARPRPRRRPMPKARVSLSTILICVIIAAQAAVLLNNYMNITVITNQINKLNSQYEKLKNDEVQLRTQYDGRFSLSEIEQYAVNVLGMIKLDNTRIEYIELASPETIVRITPEDDGTVRSFFSNVLEWFRDFMTYLT